MAKFLASGNMYAFGGLQEAGAAGLSGRISLKPGGLEEDHMGRNLEKTEKRGRPSSRTPERELAILCRLSEGDTLTAICRDLKIGVSTVYSWTEADEYFSKRFARAREFGSQILEDRAIDVARTPRMDIESVTETQDKNGNIIRSVKKADQVARSRLEAETYLKIVARRRGAQEQALYNGIAGRHFQKHMDQMEEQERIQRESRVISLDED